MIRPVRVKVNDKMRTFAREQNHGISCRSSCNGESEKWRSFYGAPHAMAGLKTSPTLLGDFRTDSRMLVLRANEKTVVGYLGRASIMAARERYHRDEQLRERGLRKSKLSQLQKV